MKENFDKCLAMLLVHEGGYSNHVRDKGGATMLGVTQAVYEKWVGRDVTIDEMKALTPADVGPIYKNNYWDRGKCDDLVSGLDWSVFDMYVNSGNRSAKILQGLVAAKKDGAIGPKTLAAVEDHDPEELIEGFHRGRQDFYEGLNTFDTFGRGWTRRNKETLEQSMDMLADY